MVLPPRILAADQDDATSLRFATWLPFAGFSRVRADRQPGFPPVSASRSMNPELTTATPAAPLPFDHDEHSRQQNESQLQNSLRGGGHPTPLFEDPRLTSSSSTVGPDAGMIACWLSDSGDERFGRSPHAPSVVISRELSAAAESAHPGE